MSSHPRIPMPMVGGRPLPGSVRSHSSRFRSPTPEPNPVTVLGREEQPFVFGGVKVTVPRGIPRSDHFHFGTNNDAPNPGPSGGSPPPPPPTTSPLAVREQLYGDITISQRGSMAFQPTPRFDNWLSGLYFFDPDTDPTGEAPMFPDVEIDDPIKDNDSKEKVAAGMKRRTVDLMEDPEPPTKRGKLSASIQRRFSRASETGRPPAAAAPATLPTLNPEAGSDPMREINARLSFFSLGGMPGVSPDRTINIAFLGDVGCGKTTFINYLKTGQFQPGEPTRIARPVDHTLVDKGEAVKVKIWDLPGTITRQHLMVDNFQAAVICFSIGDEQSYRSAIEHWYPMLTSSLAVEAHPIFVIGLKKDLRITIPHFLRFNFEEDHSVSWRDGLIATKKVNGVGYSECTAKDINSNIPRIMNRIITMTIAHVRNNEEKMRRAKRKEMNRERIENAKAAVKKTGRAIHEFLKCGVRNLKMGGGKSGGREENVDAGEM